MDLLGLTDQVSVIKIYSGNHTLCVLAHDLLAGKSTMMRLLMKYEDPRKGYCDFGSTTVKANYFAQNQADALDLSLTVLETVQENCSPEVASLADIRTLLGQFMFKGDDVYKKVGILSGGEKARVALCKMMLQPANVLMLDEVRSTIPFVVVSTCTANARYNVNRVNCFVRYCSANQSSRHYCKRSAGRGIVALCRLGVNYLSRSVLSQPSC